MDKRKMQVFAKHSLRHSPKTLDAAEEVTLDAAEESVKHSNQMLSKMAIHAFHSLSDFEEEENIGGTLKALIVAIASSDNSSDEINITDEDEDQIDVCRAAIGEYLESKGCDTSDINAMLNDFNDEATERCLSEINATLDDGDDAVYDAVDNFVFGVLDCAMIESHSELDEIAFDAVYKKKRAIVNGVKKFIKKRVSGVVKLSSKMKQHLKKLAKKPKTAASKLKFKKSMKKRKQFA